MVFELGSEQQDFLNSVRRFFERECAMPYVRSAAENPQREHAQLLGAYRALGLNEVFGDSRSARESFVELLLFASECGRSLCPVPLLEMVVAGPLYFSLFVPALTRQKIDARFGAVSDEIAAGKIAVARTPLYARAEMAVITENGDRSSISGEFRLVPLIDGLRFLIYRNARGAHLIDLTDDKFATISLEAGIDLTRRYARVTLNDAPVLNLEVADVSALDALEYALVSAEVLGACRKVSEMTADYLKTRKQFDTPIGSFQAVQHALADLFLKVEMIDSLVSFLGWALAHSPAQRTLSAQAAIRLVVREGAGIVEKSIQLHGGIGFTWEHDLHLYLRRVRALCALVGSLRSDDTALLAHLAP